MTRRRSRGASRPRPERVAGRPALSTPPPAGSPALALRALARAARDLGVVALGVAPPVLPAAEVDGLRAWLAAGHHAGMAWLAGDPAARCDARSALPGARAVIVIAVPVEPLTTLPPGPPDRAWVATYAQGTRDYHRVLGARLGALGDHLAALLPGASVRRFADTTPLLERGFARRAGLAFTGKNTCLIDPRRGSYLLWGGLVVDRDLPPGPVALDEDPRPGPPAQAGRSRERDDRPRRSRSVLGGPPPPPSPAEPGEGAGGDAGSPRHGPPPTAPGPPPTAPGPPPTAHGAWPGLDASGLPSCGTCTRCLDACPTGALPAPWVLDARRCISYLTIEHEGPWPEDLRAPSGGHVFGCDICQAVCPWNARFAPPADPELAPDAWRRGPSLTDLGRRALAGWKPIGRHTPWERAGKAGFLRNVATALGNGPGSADARALLADLAAHEDPAVREHSAWALRRLEARSSSSPGG